MNVRNMTLLVLVLLLVPVAVFAQPMDTPKDMRSLTAAVSEGFTSLTSVYLNLLSRPDSPVNQASKIIFIFISSVVIFFLLMQWMWNGQKLMESMLGILYVIVVGILLYVPALGYPTGYIAITVAVTELTTVVSEGLIKAGGAGIPAFVGVSTLEEVFAFLFNLSDSLEIAAKTCAIFCFEVVAVAIVGFVVAFLFMVIAAAAGAIIFTGKFLLALGLIMGVLFMPLFMFPFGRQIANSWLKFLLNAMMLQWVATLIIMFVFLMLIQYFGLSSPDMSGIRFTLQWSTLSDSSPILIMAIICIFLLALTPKIASSIVGAGFAMSLRQ